MTHVILGLQELDIYNRETFTLVSTSEHLTVFTLRFDTAIVDPSEVRSLVEEAGGTVIVLDEEERQGRIRGGVTASRRHDCGLGAGAEEGDRQRWVAPDSTPKWRPRRRPRDRHHGLCARHHSHELLH